ncbi:family 1 glycosylhydrolase [Ferrovum sp.]|uniref:glycoside hydrolase family 1 protein n=2 Tax=Ferrovum sp. TaxID=2609467 RepID=UPI00263475D4|nr:family 1 glycosylhydrolase [Ferrovum sp.]
MEDTELKEWQRKRRQMLGMGGAALAGSLWPKVSLAELGEAFPLGFLWGAATAGHQVEGSNINSDSWLLENMQPTLFDEPSGDACDHYNRFDQDISMLSDLGLNTFRFSIEWSRVEPEAGQFSRGQIDHYRRVLESCQRYGVRSMVTFNHFTTPRWFAGLGGWENPESSWLFARYCDWVTRHLGEWMNYATTLNEPNLTQLLFCIPGYELTKLGTIKDQEIIRKAGTRVGTGRFSSWIFGDLEQVHQGLLQAHQAGYEAIKAVRPELPVGVSIAMEDDQPVGPGATAMLERKRRLSYLPWFEMVQRHGDFLGVQAYSRARIGARGRLPPQTGYPLTDMGYEFYPEALEGVIRYTHGHVKIPLYVTENGVATMDDTRRVDYIRQAVSGVARCLAAGIDVRSYIHWSLLDNFEWLDGYRPHFGLVAVDHRTFQRHIKPSATYLGEIARQNRVLVVPRSA